MNNGGHAGAVRVATLNCRNTADRWRRRRGLLVRQLVELHPDVIGLQELRTFPNQGAWISRRARRQSPDRRLGYRRHWTGKTGLMGLWEGLATLASLPIVERTWIALGAQHRVAQRVTLQLGGGGLLQLYNAHLVSGDEAERQRQVARLLELMEAAPGVPQVLLGDFNASPARESIQLLHSRLRSAHVVVHGKEPPRTVPTPLRIGAQSNGAVVDYIFVNHLLDVHDARLVFDEVDPHDPTLVASDHYGLTATVSPNGG